MEIERKWLISPNSVPYDLSTLQSRSIEQFYVAFAPTIRARRINNGEEHILTVKTNPEGLAYRGLQREEYEFPISEAEYESLLRDVKGNIIRKTRYIVHRADSLTEEIDIFSGDLEGLAFMEIEFPDVEGALSFPDPSWVIRDVTSDGRYKNSSLAVDGIPPDEDPSSTPA